MRWTMLAAAAAVQLMADSALAAASNLRPLSLNEVNFSSRPRGA